MKTCALYHVGLKVLLKKGDEFLFLIERDGKTFDLPGGRIDDTEHLVPLPAIMAREVEEELGTTVRYVLGNPLLQFRRHIPSRGLHIFTTVYAADFLGGEIVLSDEHTGYRWMRLQDAIANVDHFASAEEFQAFKEYCENSRGI